MTSVKKRQRDHPHTRGEVQGPSHEKAQGKGKNGQHRDRIYLHNYNKQATPAPMTGTRGTWTAQGRPPRHPTHSSASSPLPGVNGQFSHYPPAPIIPQRDQGQRALVPAGPRYLVGCGWLGTYATFRSACALPVIVIDLFSERCQ